MKNRKEWVLSAFLLIALLLSSCGNSAVLGDSASGSVPAWSTVVSGSEASEAVTFQAVDVKNETAPLTEEEVLEAYDQAVTAYGWFKLETLPCGSASAIVGGNLYQRVDYAGIGTLEELETYLRGIFSQEVIDRLLPENTDAPLYRNIDGQLYVIPTSRQPDPYKGMETIIVEQSAEDTYMVNVTVDILAENLRTIAGLEVYSFPYQCVEGRWVFTNFKLVSQP